jgi:HEAT repeat protein
MIDFDWKIFLVLLAVGIAAGQSPRIASGGSGAPPSAEDRLLAVLTSAAPAYEKAAACRELKLAGTEKSVPALAALLTDEKLSQEARIALESMPYPAAGAALREAVGKAGGLARAGVIDSLGQRRDAQAVPLLAPFLADKDPNVQAAAALALGKIGTLEAASSLRAARDKDQGDARHRMAGGLLVCADRSLAADERELAAEICRSLEQSPSEGRGIRQAAVTGFVRGYGPALAGIGNPGRDIRSLLADDEAVLRAGAAAALSGLSAAGLATIAADMTKLPAQSQIAVLAAIRINGDPSLAPAAVQAAGSKDEAVALAAVRALGELDAPAAATTLIERAAGQGKLAEAARKALAASPAADVDQRIAAAMAAEKDPARRAEWLAILQARPAAAMVPLLLKEALDADAAVRGRAVAALVPIAGPRDLPGLTAAILKAEKGPERDNVERAVVMVCRQIADPQERADWLLTALHDASVADRAALLPMLGRLGGAKAMEVIRAALADADPAIHDAGVRALCNWPDVSVADELLKLAQTAKEENHRLWALRAFIRVASLPDPKGAATTDAQKLARLQQAMALASHDEERGFVLQRAAAVRTPATLRFVLPYLDQPPLAEQAAQAVVELAHHRELRDPNKAEFKPALEKVLKISKDPGTLELARRYLQAI